MTIPYEGGDYSIVFSEVLLNLQKSHQYQRGQSVPEPDLDERVEDVLEAEPPRGHEEAVLVQHVEQHLVLVGQHALLRLRWPERPCHLGQPPLAFGRPLLLLCLLFGHVQFYLPFALFVISFAVAERRRDSLAISHEIIIQCLSDIMSYDYHPVTKSPKIGYRDCFSNVLNSIVLL